MAQRRILVIGGGAAGYFAAITAAEADPAATVVIREASAQVLAKVRISGGGRCNVTHACFEPRILTQAYPRGQRELRGPLTRFGPADTIAWFEARGVTLKTEPDGRMFPNTDDSATIVSCLQDAARAAGVAVSLQSPVRHLERQQSVLVDDAGSDWDRVCLATGGGRAGHRLAESLGHTITPLAPSLFTFVCRDQRLAGLAGVSVPDAQLSLSVDGQAFSQRGPVLVTHWGLSGPAVLKLSAWAARELAAADYRATLQVRWQATAQDAEQQMRDWAQQHPRQRIANAVMPGLPRRLWESLVAAAQIAPEVTWSTLTRHHRQQLAAQIDAASFAITGKGRFKEEFVTCGGVALAEIDFRTMASRCCPGLHVIGEALDVDAITGGFNFQNAWTTGYLAGQAMGHHTA